MKFLAALLLCGCAHLPSDLTIRGLITEVKHETQYEAPCGILTRIRNPTLCDAPPVCCAYRITMRDTTGHKTYFMAFWPKWAPGLNVGETWTAKLHARPVYRLPCEYACLYDWSLAVDGDEDVKRQ